LAVVGDVTVVGPRPVIGALVRADGIRVLLLEEVAVSACPPPMLADSPALVTARIVFLGWDPYALAETDGVRWAEPAGPPLPLDPGDSVPLRAGVRLVVGPDAYRYEPLAVHAAGVSSPLPQRGRGHRRRRRLPHRSLFG
jgi:hypothetical protein